MSGVCVCEKAWRFPVVLPLDLKKTLLTLHKRRFVSASCVCSEKVSGGECGIRLSLFFFLLATISFTSSLYKCMDAINEESRLFKGRTMVKKL